MKKVDIVVMGKTGSGKSTLINAVLGEKVALTGVGQPITRNNQMYSRTIRLPLENKTNGKCNMMTCKINMLDTVGLEIDHKITDCTLNKVRRKIDEIKAQEGESDICIIWFCINWRSSRIEEYEMDLVRKLSVNHEIPVIIVFTQCLSDSNNELERIIERNMPGMSGCRVLAEDYSFRGNGVIKGFGIPELIDKSINRYNLLKVEVLENKLQEMEEEKIKMEEEKIKSEEIRIQELEQGGKEIIRRYSEMVKKIGVIPIGCIPFVHAKCKQMIVDLNKLAGIRRNRILAKELRADFIVGIIFTPAMMIPGLSIGVASAMIETAGEGYLNLLVRVIKQSYKQDSYDCQLIETRLINELKKLKQEAKISES